MRLEKLDLLRYGSFTDRDLHLPEADLCIVYGANEAGKTTALRAVTDLLFGFEERTTVHFLHSSDQLRVGGRLRGRDGRTLAIRRRKGRQRTLLDEDETPIDDDALRPFLAGIDRQRFLHAFGLSQEGLRRGSQAIIDAAGDSASGLFGAASGLSHIGAIERRLNAEADAIFTIRRSATRKFYDAYDRYVAAQKGEAEAGLRVETWQAAIQAVDDAQNRLDGLRAAHDDLLVRQRRIGRLRRVLPGLRRIASLTGELEPLAELTLLPEDLSRRREDALQRRALAQAERERREEALALLRSRREALPPPDPVLDEADRIEALAERRPLAGKAASDRPRLEIELKARQDVLDAMARKLGMRDRDSLPDGMPTAAAHAELERLLQDAGRFRAERDAAEMAVRSATAQRHALDRALAELGPLVDPAPLRRRFDLLLPAMRIRDELGAAERAVDAVSLDLDQALARLGPWPVTLEALAGLPVPGREAIRAQETAWTDLDRERTSLDQACDAERAALRAAERALAELQAGGEVPTEDAVRVARVERERLWRQVRRHLEVPSRGDDATSRIETLDAYEAAVRTADALADRREIEAARIARFAAETANRDMASARLAQLETRRASLSDALKAWQGGWTALWAPCGLKPGTPSAMREWSDLVEAARRFQVDLHRAKALEKTHRAGLAAAEDGLRALATEMGATVADPSPDAIEAALAVREAGWTRAVALRAQLANARTHQDEADATVARAEQAVASWQAQWDRSLVAFALPPGTEPDTARVVLDIWKEAPTALQALKDGERALAEARDEITAFERDVKALASGLTPEVASGPPGQVVAHLAARLAEARIAETRRQSLEQEIDQAEQALAHAKAEAMREGDVLLRLLAVAGVSDEDDLAHAIAQSERKRSMTVDLSDLRRQFALDADGFSEADLMAEASDADPDRLSADDERVSAELQESVVALGEAGVALAAARDALARLGEGEGAVDHAQAKAEAAAELAELSREWARLRTAAVLIGAALERYRKRTESPLLATAGRHFQRLTGGRFDGLAADYDISDRASLVAVRKGGGRVGVGGLSEGTADQLYLALRLAELERFASTAEPLPFLGDDLLVSFDDECATAGLEVLAEVGRSCQMLLFTHHRHLVELGREALGERLAVVDLSTS